MNLNFFIKRLCLRAFDNVDNGILNSLDTLVIDSYTCPVCIHFIFFAVVSLFLGFKGVLKSFLNDHVYTAIHARCFYFN